MPRYTTTVAKKLRTLMTELHDLRRVRNEYHHLVSVLQDIGLSGKQTLRTASRTVTKPARVGKSGKRYRSSPAEIEKHYKALCLACNATWMSRDELCKKAGFHSKACSAAFQRLAEGYELDGKKVKPCVETNGKRGLGGAYRKA